ncbi:MAG: hypothetical protein R2848_08795 [Thermomicrobiales bacterium]
MPAITNKFAAHIVEVALQVPAEYPMTAAGGGMAFDITGVDRAPAPARISIGFIAQDNMVR